jgi:hypothetical protein
MEYRNRIQETTQTTGTGTLVLNGATPGYKRFGGTNGFINNQTLRYLLEEDGPQRRWELGVGTYNATNNTLARTQVIENNSGGTTRLTLVGSVGSEPAIHRVSHVVLAQDLVLLQGNLDDVIVQMNANFNALAQTLYAYDPS